MAEKKNHGTGIEWTHHPGFRGETWNPIVAFDLETGKRGWHCERESDGCKKCYSAVLNRRGRGTLGTGHDFSRPNRDKVRIELLDSVLRQPLSWKSPRSVFVCSMTDMFAEFVTDEWIDQMLAVMALCPQHRFMVLTKRPKRMAEYFNAGTLRVTMPGSIERRMRRNEEIGMLLRGTRNRPFWRTQAEYDRVVNVGCDLQFSARPPWPLPNVWLGTSIEDMRVAHRAERLKDCPAAKRFVSFEPLIGPIDPQLVNGLDWAIIGGETGEGFRLMQLEWMESLALAAKAAGVATFVKQDSCFQSSKQGRIPDALWALKEFPEVARG